MDEITRAFQRLLDYPPWEVVTELAVIWILVFVTYQFIRGTRAAGAFKGVLVVLVVATLGFSLVQQTGVLERLAALYDKVLGLTAVALLVTFQPELRRAFIRLGETSFLSGKRDEVRDMSQALARSAGFLSKNKFGAIVAIERSVGLRDFAESGKTLNADVSEHLLNSIFWPSSPLHDMGVVIRGNRVLAAGVQFPLAQPAEMPLTHLGTRHRAAVGLSKRTDAFIVVVSEETGTISVAENGELRRSLTPEQLEALLIEKLAGPSQDASGVPMIEDPDAERLAKELADEFEDGASDSSAVTAVVTPPSGSGKSVTERRARTRGADPSRRAAGSRKDA